MALELPALVFALLRLPKVFLAPELFALVFLFLDLLDLSSDALAELLGLAVFDLLDPFFYKFKVNFPLF